jgi:signal transduction histidine kinase
MIKKHDASESSTDIRLFVLGCGLLLIVSMWLYSWYHLDQSRKETTKEAQASATISVLALSEFTRHLIESADQLSQIVQERYGKLGPGFDINTWLQETGLRLPQHTNLYITNADGKIVSANLPAKVLDIHALESVAFSLQHDSKQVYISRPLQNPNSGQWEIHLSRKISSGRFPGVVVVSIDLRNFNRFYDQSHINHNDVLTLIGEDGIIRARKAGIESNAGLDVSGGKLFPQLQKEQNGMVTETSSVDGRVRHYAFRKLADYPLFAVMGIDVSDSLIHHHNLARHTWQLNALASSFTLILTIVLYVLIGRLMQSRRQAIHATSLQQQLLFNMQQQRTAVQESAEHMQAIWEHTADALLTTNQQFLIETVNPACLHLFAASAEQLIGQSATRWLPLIVTEATPGQKLVQCKRFDDSSFPADMALTRFHLGGQIKWIISLHDNTERERINQMKTDFIATVSDKLRAPLDAISHSLNLALQEPLPESASNYLQEASRHGGHLTEMIDDLLEVHEMEAGRMHFVIKPEPLPLLLNQALNQIADFAKSCQVQLNVSGETPDCLLEADPQRFLQAMHNLLSNACKFSHKNGTVSVQAHLITSSRVRVAIIDRGVGIAESLRETLFGKFVHGPGQTGTGLGLMLARAIVEHMGGEIGYYSEIGQGATFYIELPAFANHESGQ